MKSKIFSSHFVMRLADMLLLGRFYPLCTQSSNAKWCISRNEMSTDNLNDLFLFSKEKVFMAYSISMVTGCTSQLTLWKKMKHLNLTLKVTFSIKGTCALFSLLYNWFKKWIGTLTTCTSQNDARNLLEITSLHLEGIVHIHQKFLWTK